MPSPKGPTRSEIEAEIADKTGLKKSEVHGVFEELFNVAEKALKRGAPITIPNLVKLHVKSQPAKPARTMKSPFTGEMIKVAAKPACKKVRAKPVSAIKAVV